MTFYSSDKDRELFLSGLLESASVNSITDFNPSRLSENELIIKKENNDFINSFICHLIFYGLLCCSLVLHILFDLGLGSFVKRIFIKLIEILRGDFVEKKPVFV